MIEPTGGVMMKRTTVQKKHKGAYHHGHLKTAMKEAALQLVRQKGARGFSINEASRLAGVSAGAPYRHFADKDALLAELACEGFALLTTCLQDSSEQLSDAKQAIVEAGMAYLHFAKSHTAYFLVMFQAGLDKGQYPLVERAAKEAFAVLLHLAHRYEPTPELAEGRALSSWALVHGLAALMVDKALSPAAMAGRPTLPHLKALLARSFDASGG